MRLFLLVPLLLVPGLVPGLTACAAPIPTIGSAPVLRSWLEAGPMLGHVSDTEARIWMRIAGGARVQADAAQDGVGRRTTRQIDLGEGCRLIVIEDLVPDTPVELSLTANGEPPFEMIFRSGPAPSQTGKLRIAFGSCVKAAEFGNAPVFNAMADERPDITLFVGDNCYYVRGEYDPDDYFSTGGDAGEWSRADTMLTRQLQTRRMKELDPLLRIAPCYATWDDHDFGPNNSGAEFEGKGRALKVFKQVWANPSFGTDKTPGVFGSFRRGPVEVFLMDNRYHRWSSNDVQQEVASIWGKEQLAWFAERMRASDAPVKVIANGTQVLSKGKDDDNHWRDARREYFKLLDIASETEGAIIFLTGDRHFSEIMSLEVPGERPLYEFTSSPIQQGREIGKKKGDKNPTRLLAMAGNSYGLVTIEVEGKDQGSITFECRDEHNRVPVIGGDEMKLRIPLEKLTVATEQDSK